MGETEKLNYGPQNRNLKGHGGWKGKIPVDGCDKPLSAGILLVTLLQEWADGHRSPSVNAEDIAIGISNAATESPLPNTAAMLARKMAWAICKQLPGIMCEHISSKLCVDHARNQYS